MEAEKTCDSRTCTDEVSPTPYAVSKLGTRAVDACCALGGGFTNGMNLVMGKLSPIRGKVEQGGRSVFCECNDDLQRYNLDTFTCVDSCDAGKEWENSYIYESILTDQGRCVDCPLGRDSDYTSFYCDDLPAGYYGHGEMCKKNTYSLVGAVECT